MLGKRLKRQFLSLGIVGFNSKGFTLKSGKKSFWYANCRGLSKTLEDLKETSDILLEYISTNILDKIDNFDAIIGTPEGATLLGLETQQNFIKRGFIEDKIYSIRVKEKDHGDPENRYWTNGNIPKKVIVFEDVTTTGGSVLDFVAKLEQMGIEVIAIVSLFNRMDLDENKKSVVEKMKDLGYSYYSILTSSDILQDVIDQLPEDEKTDAIDKINAEFQNEYGDDSPVILEQS